MRAAAIREDEGIGGDVVQLGEVRRREAVGPPEAVDLKPAPHGLAFHALEKRFQGFIVADVAAAAALGEHAEAHAELLGEGRGFGGCDALAALGFGVQMYVQIDARQIVRGGEADRRECKSG